MKFLPLELEIGLEASQKLKGNRKQNYEQQYPSSQQSDLRISTKRKSKEILKHPQNKV